MLSRRLVGTICTVAALGLIGPAAAGAAVITPTTTADEYNSNAGACSLREAIESANTDSTANADGCAQGSGSDSVILRDRVYSLSIPSANPGGGLNFEGDLDISTDEVEIVGPTRGRAVIDGNGAVTGHRVLEVVNLAPAIHVELHRIEITDGGAASPSDSGGGIAINGVTQPHQILLTGSVVAGNRGINGGGVSIADASSVTIRNSTVSGNRATVNGGGIHVDAGELLIEASTIAANDANSDGDFIGDGGGLYVTGMDARFVNTIIAGNRDLGQDGNVAPDCDGAGPADAISVGYSLIGDLSSCPYTVGTGDRPGGDARLAPLRDNGGPTRTHALLPGSGAINAGSPGNFCEEQDQRLALRSLGGRCDIGAYERITCRGLAVNRIGTGAADVLVGTSAADAFLLFGGNDVARGKGGGDRICAGAGNDRLFGQAGKDLLLGQAGRDRLVGGAKRDRLIGGPGRDRLIGGGGRDRCKGGPGLDVSRKC